MLPTFSKSHFSYQTWIPGSHAHCARNAPLSTSVSQGQGAQAVCKHDSPGGRNISEPLQQRVPTRLMAVLRGQRCHQPHSSGSELPLCVAAVRHLLDLGCL